MHIRLIFLSLILLACSLPTQIADDQAAAPSESPLNSEETQPIDLAAFLSNTQYNAPSFQASTADSAPRPLLSIDSNASPFISTGNSRQQAVTAEQPLRAQWRTSRVNAPFVLAMPSATLDPIIDIYRSDGTLLATVDESGTGGLEWLDLSAIGLDTTELVIVIRPFESTAGEATLITHDLAQLQPIIDVSGGVSLGEAERYDFSLTANNILFVRLIPEGNFDPVFELYSETQFLRNVDIGSNGELETFVGLQSENTADYTLTAFGFQGAEGNYRLTAIPLPCCGQ